LSQIKFVHSFFVIIVMEKTFDPVMKEKYPVRTIFTFRAIITLVFILLFGSGAVLYGIQNQELTLQKEALNEAIITASGIDVSEFNRLQGNSSDLILAEYKHLHSYLDGVVAGKKGFHEAYIIGIQDNGTVFYYVDSNRDNPDNPIEPGHKYSGILSDFYTVSSARDGYGPVKDISGDIRTVGLPLRNPRTGGIIAILGIEIEEQYWMEQLISASVFPIVVTVFLFILMLVFFFAHRITIEQNKILKASKQALLESEELFRSPVEHSLAGVFVFQNGILKYINPKGAAIFGYTPIEVLDTPITDYFLLNDVDQIHDPNGTICLNKDSNEQVEIRGIRKDGIILDLIVLPSYLNYQGKPAIFGTFLDISENKRSELALRKSEEEFRSFFEQASEGILVADENKRYVDANLNICEMFGYSREELLKLSVYDLLTPDEIKMSPLRNDLKPGQQVHSQRWMKKKNGTLILVDISIRKLADGMVIGFHRDITEKKRYEDELISTKNFLDNILNGIKDPIFVKDQKHRWILVNDALCTFIGYSRESLLGKSDFDFFPTEQAEIFWKSDDVVFSSGQDYENEEEITDSTGILHTISTKKSSYPSLTGEKILLGVIRDITERKRMENQIRKSLTEKEALLHEVHHRVNNNLQIISSLLSMQIRSVSDETVKRYLTENKSRIYAIALVYEILSHSDNIELINYSQFLQKLTKSEYSHYNINQDNVSITLNASGIVMPIVLAVPLSLIIRELLSNSLQHAFPSGSGGEISITINYDPQIRQYTCIYSDNGIGLVDGEKQSSTTTMGMSLIYGLTRQISGSLDLVSSGGVHVTITFPCSEYRLKEPE